MLSRTTKGTIEAEVANSVVRFHREQHGRGPADVRASILGDMVVVRCSGIYTPTEQRLFATEDGRRLIKSARQELRSINHGEIESLIASITSTAVLRSYYDIDVQSAEQVEIYVLDIDLEKRLLRLDLDQLNSIAPRVRSDRK